MWHIGEGGGKCQVLLGKEGTEGNQLALTSSFSPHSFINLGIVCTMDLLPDFSLNYTPLNNVVVFGF